MFIEDNDWRGPRCRMCGAPVKDPAMIAETDNLTEKLSNQGKAAEVPYFCSSECIHAKYIG